MATIIGLIWFIALLLIYISPIHEAVDIHVTHPLEFSFRDSLGFSPKLHPSIKIFAFEDKSVTGLHTYEMSLAHWQNLIEIVSSKNPKAIFIAKVFGSPLGNKDEVVRLKNNIMNASPIVAGAFVSPQKISDRPLFSFERDEYSLKKMLGFDENYNLKKNSFSQIQETKDYLYGPDPDLVSAIKRVGHLTYLGNGYVNAFIRPNAETVIPHMGFFAATKLWAKGNNFYADDSKIPIDNLGQTLVNLTNVKTFYERTKNVLSLFLKSERGLPIDSIEQDDIVIILPQMFTGNADIKNTPLGRMPGGFIVAAMINSVVTGKWLRPLPGGAFLVLILCAVGATLGTALSSSLFWASAFVSTSLTAIFGLFMFALLGFSVAWLPASFGLFGSALSVYLLKVAINEKKSKTLKTALEGMVSPQKIKEITKNPQALSFEASEQIVTIMFIDIVGFSIMAETQTPKEAFRNLKDLFKSISTEVHKIGGIVDKNLGDGLLCYFGYNYGGTSENKHHADEALTCAIKIQEQNLERNLRAAEKEEPIYQLRIGLNTAPVYIGDLGHDGKIEFTVIGNGVNLAQRFEAACDNYCIMFGATTRDLITKFDLSSKEIYKRLIKIKHHKEPVEAYEYNPFINREEDVKKAIDAYRNSVGIKRKDQRFPVVDPGALIVMTDFGKGQIVNFSSSGLAIWLENYLAKGVRIQVVIDSRDGSLKKKVHGLGLMPLMADVKWARPSNDGYVHGLYFGELSEELRSNLIELIRESIVNGKPKAV